MNGRFKIGLASGWDFVRRDILPFELVAHPATGKNGHLQFSPSETTISHRPEFCWCRVRVATQIADE
jgi:hypothetical protein